jgi:CDP-paratose 2-epimerase
MVDLYLTAAARIDEVRGQAFNVGGGMANSLSVLELLAFLGKELGVEPRVTHIAPRESDQKVFVADLAKARRLLGWQPRVGWQEGLRRMIEWVRSRG